MDDVEDGVRYVIENFNIDKNKIAIYGGSHGGYATLMGMIKTPDLYACGVDYVGVSN
jgi:dipeptidyl aminopeptidase/acylaminoacyl peptidase